MKNYGVMTGRLAAFFAGLLMAGTLAGCASGGDAPPEPGSSGINVEGIIIRNSLPYVVTDVMVEVPATGGFAGCGNIIQRTECRTSFPARDYKRNPILVSWKERGSPHQTDEFVVDLPAGAQPGDVVWLEVIVFAPGQAGARLVQP